MNLISISQTKIHTQFTMVLFGIFIDHLSYYFSTYAGSHWSRSITLYERGVQ